MCPGLFNPSPALQMQAWIFPVIAYWNNEDKDRLKKVRKNNLATHAWLDKIEDKDVVWNQRKILEHGNILYP